MAKAKARDGDAPVLPPVDGIPTVEAVVKILGAGDGLSKALELEPVPRHVGHKHSYVLSTIVEEVGHKGITPANNALRQISRERTIGITEVPNSAIQSFLDEAQQRIAMAERERAEAEAGSVSLPIGPPEGKTWTDMKVEDVLSAARSDADLAKAAYEAELDADRPRQGLLRRLAAIVDGD